MKRFSFFGLLGGLLLVVLLGTAAVVANGQNQNVQERLHAAIDRNSSLDNSRATWEYARLVISDDVVAWQAGATNVEPEALSLEIQYRRLGGQFRPNLTNLLNLIGTDGWELVTTDETVWTFKRRR